MGDFMPLQVDLRWYFPSYSWGTHTGSSTVVVLVVGLVVMTAVVVGVSTGVMAASVSVQADKHKHKTIAKKRAIAFFINDLSTNKKCAAEATHEKHTAPIAATQLLTKSREKWKQSVYFYRVKNTSLGILVI